MTSSIDSLGTHQLKPILKLRVTVDYGAIVTMGITGLKQAPNSSATARHATKGKEIYRPGPFIKKQKQ
jgi:hypothetical protein